MSKESNDKHRQNWAASIIHQMNTPGHHGHSRFRRAGACHRIDDKPDYHPHLFIRTVTFWLWIQSAIMTDLQRDLGSCPVNSKNHQNLNWSVWNHSFLTSERALQYTSRPLQSCAKHIFTTSTALTSLCAMNLGNRVVEILNPAQTLILAR